MTVRIITRARGPLVVEHDGDVPLQILRSDGSQVDVAELRKIRLCRCGASACAPLCDGAHNRIGFEAPAVEDDGVGRP